MTAHDKGGARWRHTTVLIRADIFASVHEQGIDISNECNRALADLVGIDYHQQLLEEEAAIKPVIVARDGKTARSAPDPNLKNSPLRPVLNAEDPATPATVLQQKKDRPPRQADKKSGVDSGQGQETQQESSARPAPPAPLAGSRKKERPQPSKRMGGDKAIRRFVSTKVVRTDAGSGGGGVPKDEMFQRFVRWCKANSVSPVPDKRSFSVALKNRFAVQESTVNHVPCWLNVTMK
jgi:hypothetical protein